MLVLDWWFGYILIIYYNITYCRTHTIKIALVDIF